MDFKGILIGGLLPALAFGATGLLQKVAMRTGVGLGPYLLCIGVGVAAVGGAIAAVQHTAHVEDGRTLSLNGALTSVAVGVSWAIGMALVALGIAHYGVPLAKLAPLYNLNTLIVAVLALVVFAEFREVATAKLLGGTALMLGGAWLVARA